MRAETIWKALKKIKINVAKSLFNLVKVNKIDQI